MTDYIVIGIILIIIGLAVGYLVKAKKRGVKCIGCPEGCKCSAKSEGDCNGGGCSCRCDD